MPSEGSIYGEQDSNQMRVDSFMNVNWVRDSVMEKRKATNTTKDKDH